jgi:hypothetical protein
MKLDLLTIDPDLVQHYQARPESNLIERTEAEVTRLKVQRKASAQPTLRQTRDQRNFDVTHKLLKEGEDILKKLRSLAVGNYFCVPLSQSTNVRNAAYRETKERGVKYTTTKFIFGKYWFVKVLRHNSIHD